MRSPTFEPRLDIMPESQRLMWPELDAVPADFVLYGCTGLVLQLGHRGFEDFDFFSSSGFDPDRLRSRLPFFRDLNPADHDVWVHRKRDNLCGLPVGIRLFCERDRGDVTTLRLRAIEIGSQLDLPGIEFGIEPLRERAHSQRVTWWQVAWRPAANTSSATDCDRFLKAVGKEKSQRFLGACEAIR